MKTEIILIVCFAIIICSNCITIYHQTQTINEMDEYKTYNERLYEKMQEEERKYDPMFEDAIARGPCENATINITAYY